MSAVRIAAIVRRVSSNDRHTPGAVAFFTIGLIASIVAFGWLFFGFFTDCVLAFLFTGLLGGTYSWTLSKVKGRQAVVATLMSLLLVITVAIPVTFIVTSLSVEAHSAYVSTKDSVTMEKLEGYLFGEGVFARNAKTAADALGIDYDRESVSGLISRVLGAVATFLYGQVEKVLSNLVGFLYHFTLMVLVVFYMLIDGKRLKAFVFRLSPLPETEEELITQQFKAVGRAILFGNGAGSVLQGFMGGVAMAVAGLPSPVLWGVVMSIFAFLPLVGISIVVLPATAYLLLHERYVAALVFFLFCMLVAVFVENVVKTRLIGQQMKMHNLLIFLSILGGLSMFGILGILYGPLIVAFFLTMTELYHSHYKPQILGEERAT